MTARTSPTRRVTRACVRPEAVTNSTSRPSGSYVWTTAPRSPFRRPLSGTSRSRTTVSSSLNFIALPRECSHQPRHIVTCQDHPHSHHLGASTGWSLKYHGPRTSGRTRWTGPLPQRRSGTGRLQRPFGQPPLSLRLIGQQELV